MTVLSSTCGILVNIKIWSVIGIGLPITNGGSLISGCATRSCRPCKLTTGLTGYTIWLED